MSKNLEKKLLAESLDALVNDNDIAKATRLMRRHLDLVAQSQYQLLESEDEDFEVTDMGDDFNSEVAAEAGSDDEEKFDNIQIAIDELEDKYPAEMSEDIESKFDELRNIVDELKLVEEGDEDVSVDDALVVIEDLRADFEMAGELSEDVSELFDEITSGLQGDSEIEEIEADDDSEFEDEEVEEVDDSDDELEEGCHKKVTEADDSDVDLTFEEENEESEDSLGDETEEMNVDVEEEEPADDEELIFDIKSDAEELLAKIEELESGEKSEEKPVEEGFEKIADPRKKASSEGEGVEKKRTMNFGKLTGMTLKKGSDLLNGKASKGTEPSKKAPVKDGYENKGAKSWHKIEKPANKAASSKSVLGK